MNQISPPEICQYCSKYDGSCGYEEDTMCWSINPVDINKFEEYVYNYIVETSNTEDKNYQLHHYLNRPRAYEELYTLEQYHVNYIDDVIQNIRAGNEDYIYSIDNLVEIYSFEPRLQIFWCDGCFRISL